MDGTENRRSPNASAIETNSVIKLAAFDKKWTHEIIMDSWEDEEVDEVSISLPTAAPASWEDEEDETLVEQAAAMAAGKIPYV